MNNNFHDSNIKKIGQLFILGLDVDNIDDKIISFISRYNIGGVILYKKNYSYYDDMINIINKIKGINIDIPLFISVDQENGLVSRLPNDIDVIKGVRKQASTKDIKVISECNNITIDILKNSGINMNFAPVVDVDHFNSMFLKMRCYGSNKEDIIKYGLPFMNSLNDNGIISVIKHFPGHGLVKGDSHKLIPKIKDTLLLYNDLEIYKEAINSYCMGIMVGHLMVFGYGFRPASINKKIIKELLIDKFNYKGLIITDDLMMGYSKYLYGIKRCVRYAIEGNNDMVMIKYNGNNLNKIKNCIKYIDKCINIDRIDYSYNKIIDIKNKYNINMDKVSNNLDIISINERIKNVNKLIRDNIE